MFALIWLYASWIILLLGAQLAFYIQHPQYLRPGRGEIRLSPSMRERIALSIMYLIVHDFGGSQHRWTINLLAEHLDIPGAAIGQLVTALERKRLLLLAAVTATVGVIAWSIGGRLAWSGPLSLVAGTGFEPATSGL